MLQTDEYQHLFCLRKIAIQMKTTTFLNDAFVHRQLKDFVVLSDIGD